VVGQALLHRWSTHCPTPQAVQAQPLEPQALLAVPSWQTLLASQQPVGHEVASQTQTPAPLHSWPVGQAAQVAPAVPQKPSPVSAA
jgi:hypothetical protein